MAAAFARRVSAGIDVRPAGAGTAENRQMLAAFRWNLETPELYRAHRRRLSDLQHHFRFRGAPPPRNRHRPRARSAAPWSRPHSSAKPATIGIAGARFGLPLGRLMAIGTVKLMAARCESLYVSSRPGSIDLSPASIALALLGHRRRDRRRPTHPPREASLVPPAEAIARGRREYDVRMHKPS